MPVDYLEKLLGLYRTADRILTSPDLLDWVVSSDAMGYSRLIESLEREYALIGSFLRAQPMELSEVQTTTDTEHQADE